MFIVNFIYKKYKEAFINKSNNSCKYSGKILSNY